MLLWRLSTNGATEMWLSRRMLRSCLTVLVQSETVAISEMYNVERGLEYFSLTGPTESRADVNSEITYILIKWMTVHGLRVIVMVILTIDL